MSVQYVKGIGNKDENPAYRHIKEQCDFATEESNIFKETDASAVPNYHLLAAYHDFGQVTDDIFNYKFDYE